MSSITRILALTILTILQFGVLAASDLDPAGRLFARAQRLVREKEYAPAISTLEELVKKFPDSPDADKYLYALARAKYQGNQHDDALKLLDQFIDLFPTSPLYPYAGHLIGNCQYRLGRPGMAFLSYLSAYEAAPDDQLRQISGQSMAAVVDNGYIPADSTLNRLPPEIGCRIKSRVVNLMKDRWSKTRINKLMAGCARELHAGSSSSVVIGGITVGVILPLDGPYAKFGQALLNGVMLAAESARQDGIPIKLDIYDSKADHLLAAKGVNALAEKGVDVIFGPLLSEVAATAAAAAQCHQIPLLVPAATQAGFTTLSPFCFQMTPNITTVGRGMAQYAIGNQKMKKLAVICPTTLDEMTLAGIFADEVVRLGAPRPIIVKFRPDETDFGPYLRDLKLAAKGKRPDSIAYLNLSGDTLEPGMEPVMFDGIFIPAAADQLNLLLPQLDFYQVRGKYLGTEEWDTDKVRKLEPKVLREPVFYSGDGACRNATEFATLDDLYTKKFNLRADRLAALGYDAVILLAQSWQTGHRGPFEIGTFLSSLSGFTGTTGRITFGRGRSNLELPLFTIRSGKMIPLSGAMAVDETDATASADGKR